MQSVVDGVLGFDYCRDMENAIATLVKVAGIAHYFMINVVGAPRDVNVFLDTVDGVRHVAINSYHRGTVAKVGNKWVITSNDGTTGAEGRTLKAALVAFATPRVLALFAEVHTVSKPWAPTACGTCGDVECRSRFDCSRY